MTSNAGSLVCDLLRREADERDATTIVTLRTTHASWVFLVGYDVWKVKPPNPLRILRAPRGATRRICRMLDAEVQIRRISLVVPGLHYPLA